MIHCTIDGKVGYPTTTDRIKVTYENQYINDSGSYTYDISFPMSIHENQLLFHNIHRFDVKKKMAAFEECRLYVDNRLVMSGKGTVISISDTVVKLQIVGGKSRIKYNSNFENHYIDEIPFPAVRLNRGIDTEGYAKLGMQTVDMSENPSFVMIDLRKSSYVGEEGIAVFNPIYDETNNVMSNFFVRLQYAKLTVNGTPYPVDKAYTYMTNAAVQPYLLYVLRKVLEYEGYTITTNGLDKDPWNRLVIASARRSCRIADALPHWTVYKFIEEVRKLFNASFVFNEVKKTVEIRCTGELYNNDTVCYDALDEYSCEYDEDGLQNIATSNVAYALAESENRSWKDVISQDVMKRFEVRECTTTSEMHDVMEKMTRKERMTTIFKVMTSRCYYISAMQATNAAKPDDLSEQVVMCGFFNPLIRDMDNSSTEELDISPVAFGWLDRYCFLKGAPADEKFFMYASDEIGNYKAYTPSTVNAHEPSAEDYTQDGDGEYFLSVQNAIDGEEDDATEEDADDKLQIMFQGRLVANLKMASSFAPSSTEDADSYWCRYPTPYTDWRPVHGWPIGLEEKGSLSLELSPFFSADTEIDKNNLLCIKFVTDEIPDPSRIYTFHNKRFICQKVELQVGTEGIDRLKTGYFYEKL